MTEQKFSMTNKQRKAHERRYGPRKCGCRAYLLSRCTEENPKGHGIDCPLHGTNQTDLEQ